MNKYSFSIRTMLLMIITALTVLIAAQSGYRVYVSWQSHQQASKLQQISSVMNLLFTSEKFFSLERGASVALVYLPAKTAETVRADVISHRQQADDALQAAMDLLTDQDEMHLSSEIEMMQDKYEALKKTREKILFGKILSRRDKAALSDEMFDTSTALIESIHNLTDEYSAPYLRENPATARQIRFSGTIWSITEYAGREYTRLAQLIAENARPTQKELEELSMWRGRVQYGWELAHNVISTSEWAKRIEPSMDEAENYYFVTFDQIKEMFYQNSRLRPSYPITIDMWLELASQAVDSLHSMSDAVLDINKVYGEEVKQKAERAIIFSLLLFFSALLLGVYSWWVITYRVIRPVNTMVDSLYKATRGDNYALPENEDEIGKLANVLVVFQENSRQLEIERDKAAAANIAKSEFLANMSHEIRTPMNVILGLSNILANSKPLTDKQAEFIRTLKMSGEALLSIINDVLDFSKIETKSFELESIPFNLGGVIQDLGTQMQVNAKQKNLKFDVDIRDVEGKEYLGDPTRLRQILTNLCGNALKFTETGGVTVSVTSESRDGDEQENVYISVKDTGVGIPADKLDYIFDKFTQADSTITRKFGGTGLGLAISRAFAEMMEGAITVESVEGQGSIFTVALPLKCVGQQPVIRTDENNAAKQEETLIENPATDRPVTVLLVEDYQPNALVAETYLEEFGFVYELAEDGSEAVEMVRARPYDVILMDVQMREMDGYQATRAIRTLEKDLKRPASAIIGMTAHALIGDREKCLEAGMDDYLSKPFTPDALEDMILRLTGRQEGALTTQDQPETVS